MFTQNALQIHLASIFVVKLFPAIHNTNCTLTLQILYVFHSTPAIGSMLIVV